MTPKRERVSLGELYEFSSGLSKSRADFGFGYPFLSFKDVFYNSAVPKVLNELANSTDNERIRCSVNRGDVFLTRTSETLDELGMSSVALTDIPNATFNGFTKRLRPKYPRRVSPEFARYYFRCPAFRREVNAMSSMSTRASLNNEMLARLTIVLPPLSEQEDIGRMLGALDDRIESLRQATVTLEMIAAALFKSWCVDFHGVATEGKQESEIGPIPKGWSVRPLDSIADYLNGLALQKFSPQGETEFLPVIKIAQLRAGNTDGADEASMRIKPEYIVEDGDVLFSWSGSLEVEMWSGGRGALNQHLFKVTSREVPKWFYYFSTRQHLRAFRAIAAGKATTMGHIQRRHLTEAMIAVPPPDVMAVFDTIVAPLLEQKLNHALRARTISGLRDQLLPRLISGSLSANAAGPIEEEAK